MKIIETLRSIQAGASPGRPRRGDIDGLRAVAVLGVMAYHLGLPGVPGGFAGVDIFFVISGYLIARIIASELEADRFSLLSFYDRRIRRILPAVVVVSLSTVLIGYVLLLPADFLSLGYSLLSVATFSSNFYFMSKTGYFGGNADEYPLLHTWSLAIEEQFYLVFPIAILLLWQFGAKSRRGSVRTIRWALIAAITASFLYSLYLVDTRPARAFFSTPVRAWELLAGALLAFGVIPAMSSQRRREQAAIAGLVLIAITYVFLSETTPFPGLAALLPVTGTLLVLHAGAGYATAAGQLLSVGPLQIIGLASYSIYLWHWPLIALARYRWPMEVSSDAGLAPVPVVVVGALSIVLGLLSWRYIEQPFLRMRPPRDPRRTIEIALAPTLLSAALAFAIISGNGWWERWPTSIQSRQAWTKEEAGWLTSLCTALPPERDWPQHACRAGSEAAPVRTLLWGDSHARRLLRGLEPRLVKADQAVIAAITPGCPPLVGVRVVGRSRTKARCNKRNNAINRQLSNGEIDTVILVGRWAMYAEGTRYGLEAGENMPLSNSGTRRNAEVIERGFERTVASLVGKGLKVVIVGPVPEHKVPVSSFMLRQLAWGTPDVPDLTMAVFGARQQHVLPVLEKLSRRPGVTVLYPHRYLCAPDVCRYQADGAPLYLDHDHLTDRGLQEIDPILDQLEAIIEGPTVPAAKISGAS